LRLSYIIDDGVGDEKQGWASSWTDLPSSRPQQWIFRPVRPHKVSNKLRILTRRRRHTSNAVQQCGFITYHSIVWY